MTGIQIHRYEKLIIGNIPIANYVEKQKYKRIFAFLLL